LALEPGSPLLIVVPALCFGVLATIDLHHESPLKAYEIHDVRSDGNLPSKLYSGELPGSELRPKELLRFGGLVPELSSTGGAGLTVFHGR
jgi:hypothetical protein